MTTRLYLHAATSGVAGTLPSAEQSTLTADDNFEANQATNRSMSRFIGTSQTSLANASIASSSVKNYYIGRWVSEPLTQTSVAANTWTLNFAFAQSNISANFPAAQLAAVRVHVYVWKPSNGTKYGTIIDGLTTTTIPSLFTAETTFHGTFSGSAVSSLTSGDAVIVYEAWGVVTQSSASSYTQTFYFDGTVVTPTNGTGVSDNASFISTPEDLSLSDNFTTTKLYLHATTSGIPSGTLPSAEQSTKTVTSACQFEGSDSTNRLMNTSIGVSQATLTLNTPASVSANTYYVSRWVSPVLSQTSVAAGPWTYNFAARENNVAANYPCSSTNKAVWVNCYVWKPSDGTKYGTILDGNTAATVSEGAANTEKSQEADFTGSAVSSLTSGDACIVFEVWFAITQQSTVSYVDDFFYDGTTETAGGSTVSNHASFLNYIGDGLGLSFTSPPAVSGVQRRQYAFGGATFSTDYSGKPNFND